MGNFPVGFNLVSDPWLPAHAAADTRRLYSLETLFQQAGALTDLDLRPHERVAVMRLLICITQAALDAPEDECGWEEFAIGFEEKISAYLRKHRAAFELFGDGPRFLQIKPVEIGNSEFVSKFIFHLATGSNPKIFDHAGGSSRVFPPSIIALALLTFQNFYPAYGTGHKGVGPCVNKSMVHTLVRGKNLRDAILFNCLDQRMLNRPQLGGMGRPIWEQFPRSPTDDVAVANATRTYLGRLVPIHRPIWITDDRTKFFLGYNGWVYPTFEQYREPTCTVIYNAKEKKEQLLYASLHRAVWRELHTLTVLHRNKQFSEASGPPVLESYELSNRPHEEEVSIWTGALAVDTGKILDTVESIFHLPAHLFDFTGRDLYANGVTYAQSRGKDLINAIKAYGKAMKHDNPPVNRAMRRFWNALDQQSTRLLELVRDTSLTELHFGGASTDPWTAAVRAALHEAYNAVCPRLNPRQIEAYALGLRALSPAPAKAKTLKLGKARGTVAVSAI